MADICLYEKYTTCVCLSYLVTLSGYDDFDDHDCESDHVNEICDDPALGNRCCASAESQSLFERADPLNLGDNPGATG